MSAQFNVDRLITSGKVALHYEDYVLSIQYFNQAISLKPYLWEPWQYRAIAKFYLDDYSGAEIDASEAINLNPYIAEIYDLRGISRIRQKKYDGAIYDYNKALRVSPDNRNYWYNRAVCKMEKKDYEACSLDLDTIIRKWKKYAPPYLLKVEINLLQKDTVKATEWLDRSLEVDPYNAEAWRMRANIALSREEWRRADSLYSKVIHLKPKNVASYLNRAVARLKINNLRGAMQDYDFALEFDPTNFLGHYNRGLLRQQVGDDNRAIEDFDFVISLEPDNIMAIFNRATLLDRVGDLKRAIADYSRVIDEFPNFWTGLHYRASCYRRLGMTAKAEMDEFRIYKAQMNKHLGIQQRWSRKKITEIRKKSEIDPEKYNEIVVEDNTEPGDHEYKSEYRGKVQNRHVDEDYQPYVVLSPYEYDNALKANKPFDRYVDEFNMKYKQLTNSLMYLATLPDQVPGDKVAELFAVIDTLTARIADGKDDSEVKELLLARSAIYTMVQNYEDAVRDVDAYLSIDPTSALAWWQRAVSNARLSEYEMTQNRQNGNLMMAGVVSDFEKAASLHPDNAYIYYCEGTFYASRGDETKAIELFTKALAIDDRLPEAYYNRGIAYLHKGIKDKAFIDLGKAGELGLYQAYSIIKSNNKDKK